jgi:hypothetical protein
VPGVPRIPRVLSYFEHENTAYIVIEYVKLAGSPLDPESTVAALKWLSEVPLPPEHIIGPLEGGPIRHRFFKYYEAPLRFSSVEALERYIEKVRPRIDFFQDAPSANIAQSGPGAHSAPNAVLGTGARCPYHRRAILFHATRRAPEQLWPRRAREPGHYGFRADCPVAPVLCRINHTLEPWPRAFRRVLRSGEQC